MTKRLILLLLSLACVSFLCCACGHDFHQKAPSQATYSPIKLGEAPVEERIPQDILNNNMEKFMSVSDSFNITQEQAKNVVKILYQNGLKGSIKTIKALENDIAYARAFETTYEGDDNKYLIALDSDNVLEDVITTKAKTRDEGIVAERLYGHRAHEMVSEKLNITKKPIFKDDTEIGEDEININGTVEYRTEDGSMMKREYSARFDANSGKILELNIQ